MTPIYSNKYNKKISDFTVNRDHIGEQAWSPTPADILEGI